MTSLLRTSQRVLVCDGAMGTMLHAAGAALDRSLPELNLSDPGLVSTIHESYLSAGADIIQANTFGANRLWLGDHGFPDKVDEINRAGVRIARAAQARCDRDVLVAGSVSPAVTARQRRQVGSAERAEVLREQISSLLAHGDEPGGDLIILETCGYLDELVEAVAVAADLGDVPVIAQATFADDAHTLGGETPREVATVLSALPVAMLGTNCTIGPQRMLTVAEDLVRYASVPVSAQPNAGQPRRTGPRSFEFSIDGGYFARYFRRFAEAGVSLVGGCCGTTPRTSAPRPARSRRSPRGPGAPTRPEPEYPELERPRHPARCRSPGPWPTSWPTGGSSSPPRSRPAGARPRRCRPQRCCAPRAPGCSRSSRPRAPAPIPTPLTWRCTCSSRPAWRPSPR
jgi:homocysteine S-methyltransferase